MQLKVTNSPFTEEQAELLNKLLPTLTEAQIHWLGGYLTFYRSGAEPVAVAQVGAPNVIAEVSPVVVSEPAVPREATILFGSQTGNSQRLSGRLAEKLKEQGFEVTLSAMNAYKTNGLKKTAHLFIVASTHGEGDPPDNAIPFYEFLYSKRAPKLDGLKYSVLALGDTSYEFFCKTGRDFDDRLAELGAERLVDRVECDLDFEGPATEWFGAVIGALQAATSPGTTGAAASAVTSVTSTSVSDGDSQYTRLNPFRSEVLTTINLNGRGADRETRHLELSLEGSGLSYEPGDCVGIYPENDPALVDAIIAELNFSANEVVVQGKDGDEGELRSALLRHFEITVLSRPLLEKALPFSENGKLAELLSPEKKDEVRAYTNGRDLLDLLQDFAPWKLSAVQLISILRKLPPRLYSIASSNRANPDEVHLTIRKVQYEAHGRKRNGVCSVQTSERLSEGDTLPIFIQQNPNFKLPADPQTPIIMVGPGTGVAPFRAFMEEREELGSEGKTWLFYGDRNFVTDFLYQTDWQRMLKDGVLTKLDVAFSRDSKKKVYVQDRMREKASELYKWLQEGAHVYVCGDEKHMAHDVHAALLTIIEQQGGLDAEGAKAYLADLQTQQRYQRDVY
ncbi:assimilatory sulfite reductase (NADPH) flavoprotein subunit [Paenibacillus sp. GSMTC-2017]|uniref:assimilatory sulfite reductase (NADPH) flavoprotein subunit n=1 Tax=Paenibacillus sp. GSMTC-2017 TaxID=2794350 RepID=UPI0018D77234|nr:assimilatory sulfite reductase (NADPH) flavoprotein subunit [Paenibacillus sp. GSMTC-2017]MBH5319907.1 assimilatory sulfite reductase (NADPH) flavoprotein subunit [Paenibacillus sp. GSMTC-2017]